MEESEKRRERLKAMRMEAAAGANSDSSGLSSSGLSNPLIESESASPSQYTSSRFGYYTDPMAAYSGSRRNITPQVSQGHYNTPPRPMYQDMNPSTVYHGPGINNPSGTIFQVPGPHFNQSPHQNPVQVWGRPQGNLPNARGSPLNYSVPPPNPGNPGLGQGNSPYVGYGRASNPGLGQGNSPYVGYGRASDPGLGQGNSPYVGYDRGRGQRSNSSPQYDRGRGSGRGGRRGGGSFGPVSAEQRPDMYYTKEMVEDPWKMLSPVIWKDINATDSEKSWLPKSISMKKAKVSGEASISQQSLAQYLAASFNDSTADDEQAT